MTKAQMQELETKCESMANNMEVLLFWMSSLPSGSPTNQAHNALNKAKARMEGTIDSLRYLREATLKRMEKMNVDHIEGWVPGK